MIFNLIANLEKYKNFRLHFFNLGNIIRSPDFFIAKQKFLVLSTRKASTSECVNVFRIILFFFVSFGFYEIIKFG